MMAPISFIICSCKKFKASFTAWNEFHSSRTINLTFRGFVEKICRHATYKIGGDFAVMYRGDDIVDVMCSMEDFSIRCAF